MISAGREENVRCLLTSMSAFAQNFAECWVLIQKICRVGLFVVDSSFEQGSVTDKSTV
jgi:hypothetical protein